MSVSAAPTVGCDVLWKYRSIWFPIIDVVGAPETMFGV